MSISPEERIAQLEAANNALLQEKNDLKEENQKLKKINLKVTVKGCVGLYGLRQYPISFYPKEWMYFFDHMEEILEFIEENKVELAKILGEKSPKPSPSVETEKETVKETVKQKTSPSKSTPKEKPSKQVIIKSK